ncbi:MAG: hypothetical protein A3G34_03400 [Candidatus Lindowbacteria bacterium RIFCSPLOWO2_12_FULL_62_27]|nr:MAG: hypothetical protein A3G34_03400 [Candidatus Lindowbacteria bacterium RIFCSPLOWO2_12_FULL_62_27]
MRATAAFVAACFLAAPGPATAAQKPPSAADTHPKISQQTPRRDTSLIDTLAKAGDGWKLAFSHISGFTYDISNEDIFTDPETAIARLRQKKLIPAPVRALDGEKVSLVGYMMPIDFSEGTVRSFILLPNQQACCFGIMPKMNEMIFVTFPDGRGTKLAKDMPLEVSGRIRVGENVYGESVFALYHITADRVEPTREGIELRDEIQRLQNSLIRNK